MNRKGYRGFSLLRNPRGVAFLTLAAMIPVPAAAAGKGVFEAVPLREREEHLLSTANEYEDRFLRRGYRFQDPDLGGLLERIGRQLQPEATDPYIRYRFFLFRDPMPNAFALPDGQVYVNTGMVAWLENEAQLAGLLGHEITHVAGHHGILSFRSIRKKVITSIVLGPFTLGLSDIFLILAILGYSRDLEEEADRSSIQPVLELGYDVREVPKLFEILDRDFEGIQPRRSTKWLTHPQLQERSIYLREMISRLPGSVDLDALRTEEESYQKRTRPLALRTVSDLIQEDYPRSAVVLARKLVDRVPADPAGHLAVGDAFHALGPRSEYSGEEEVTKREKRKNFLKRIKKTREEREQILLETEGGRANLKRNLNAAREAYLEALDRDSGLAEARRGLGYVHLKLGDHREAARNFLAYLKQRSDALDKAAILTELQTITKVLRSEREGEADADEND